MNATLKSSFLALVFAAAACDSGTSSDPATVSRDVLQPPTSLITVTGDKSIELRWQAANVEKDFKGFHVFAVADKSIADLGKPGFPANLPVDLMTGSIPRCKENNGIFHTVFGLPESKADCAGDAEKPAAGAGSTAYLAETGTEEKIANIVKCTDDTTISLPATPGTLGEVSCKVTKLHDGTPLENGKLYTFFVVAVAGEDKNTISWTSNFVEDRPATPVYSKADFTIEQGKYYVIPHAKLSALTAIVDADITSGACDASTATICNVNQINNNATDGIYIARRGSADPSYPQRVFISVPNNTTQMIKLIPRGNQVKDPMTDAFATSIPGDMAVNTTYTTGTLHPVYGNQVFDLEVTVGTAKHYGKIVFGQPRLATPTDKTSNLTVPMTIIMQPAAGQRHYLTESELDF